MKRLLLCAALLSVLAASAQTLFTFNNLKFETNADGPWTVTLTGTTASENESIVIPENVSDGNQQYLVTRIGDAAFMKSKIAGEVKIPATVTHIGTSAFKNATSISSVVIPKSVVWMGDDAFYNCTGLSYVYLGAEPEYEYVHRGRDKYSFAFYNIGDKSGHLTLEIGSEVKSVEYSLFMQSNVTELKFSEGSQCAEIADRAFQDTPLTGILDLPSSLRKIGANAFLNTALSTIKVPRGVSSVGSAAFSQIDKIERIEWDAEAPETGSGLFIPNRSSTTTFDVVFGPDVRILPDGLFDVNNEVFYGSGIRSITWPADSKIEYIGSSAFAGNIKLTGDLSLPSSVRKVGYEAFGYCSGLTSATLHSGIEEMGNNVLVGCVGIRTLNYDVAKGMAPFGNGGISDYNFDTEKGISVKIGPNVKEIPEYFLSDANDIPLKVYLSEALSLESIGEAAFASCTNITFDSLRFPDGMKAIAANAFFGKITADVRIPASLNPIKNGTFDAITASSLTLCNNNLTHLGGLTVKGPVTIESNVTGIAKNLFDGQDITTLTFAEGSALESIGEQAFHKSSISGTLHLPDGIKEIGQSAFEGCTGLTGLSLPISVDSIASGAFSGCENIAGELSLPAGLRIIGPKSFKDCKGIVGELTIPASVMELGGGAFEGTSLSSLVIEDSEEPLVFNDSFNKTGSWIIKAPSRAVGMGPGLAPGQFRNVTELYIGRNLQYLCGAMYDTGVTRNYFSPFNGFTRFDKVTLSQNCNTLLAYMFAGDDNCIFSELVVESENPPTVDETTFRRMDCTKCTLVVPKGSEQLYASTPVWNEFFTADGIDDIDGNTSRTIIGIHSLDGVNVGTSIDNCGKGNVYIIVYSDGTTEKVVI